MSYANHYNNLIDNLIIYYEIDSVSTSSEQHLIELIIIRVI